MIIAQDLTCGYQQLVLDHLNFEVPAGQITALIGPNGSGKSTLAQALAGLLKFRGQVQIDELTLTQRTSARILRRAIGLVLQNPAHQLLFTRVQDDLEFILENLQWPIDERPTLIREALATVGLSELALANPRTLSGGQQQRLALASAILTHPRYLILDEATSMVDSASRQSIYQTLQQLARQGIGILLITNTLDELLLAQKVLILHQRHIHPYHQSELIQNPSLLARYNLQPSFTLSLAQKYQLYSWSELVNYFGLGAKD